MDVQEVVAEGEHPIGLIDSGVGGLSVLGVVRRVLPVEHLVYVGDSGRMPYGTRPAAVVRSFTRQMLRLLEEQGVKAAVIACNTATAVTWPHVANEFSFPVLGMIEAGARAAVRASQGRVGVMATPAAVASEAYPAAIRSLAPGLKVWQRGCGRLPVLVEKGQWDAGETREAVRADVSALLDRGVDTIVLGCSHLPFLGELIRAYADGVRIVDPADELVTELARLLADRHLLRPPSAGRGWVRVYTSGEPAHFRELYRQLVGEQVEVERWVVPADEGEEGRESWPG